jgi:hypothetical protein
MAGMDGETGAYFGLVTHELLGAVWSNWLLSVSTSIVARVDSQSVGCTLSVDSRGVAGHVLQGELFVGNVLAHPNGSNTPLILVLRTHESLEKALERSA